MAFAPDGLASLGRYPGDDYMGGQMFNKIDKGKMSEDMCGRGPLVEIAP